jgi:murein DD-endopeptidase MepM/ murein hydrolase activator NlpD
MSQPYNDAARITLFWSLVTVVMIGSHYGANSRQWREVEIVEIPREYVTERVVEVHHGAIAAPTAGTVSSGWGPRTGYGGQAGWHRGVDIAAPSGSPVYSPIDGVVVEHWPPPDGKYQGHPIYGGAIYIAGGEYLVLIAHLSRSDVHEGMAVAAGQLIGGVGSTGWSTGPHVHIEVWINPSVIMR